MKLTDQRDKHTRELERLKKENFVLSCKVSGFFSIGNSKKFTNLAKNTEHFMTPYLLDFEAPNSSQSTYVCVSSLPPPPPTVLT